MKPGNQVIGLAVGLYLLGSGLGMLADLLVQVLAISAGLDGFHQNLLGRHEWKFSIYSSLYHFWIDDQAARDVADDQQATIDCQEGFGDGKALVG